MPKTTLTYFPLKALGEHLRLLLAYGGEDFEDVRLDREQFMLIKSTTPFGQLPVLEMNGRKLAQSTALARYLGRKYGIAGANADEDLEIDQHVDFVHDIRSKAGTVQYEDHEEVREKKHAELSKNFYPVALEKLDAIIKKNNGHLALGKLTWGDFLFAGVIDYVKHMMRMDDLYTKYPSFKQLRDTVYGLPKVKEFSQKCPPCDF
ncbi:glutathione S-transferase 2-like [Aricia agestis]|uniref:glutathione S-transferase 2-like n=1 Tax=Aricia agestis TaxID=91739 RepID=UPI001C20258A|nr:glutathione S-transferase 2-like [Aricia agestis]XP_041982323.1 glutathione S-transferase 2-like [Aricia agestis]